LLTNQLLSEGHRATIDWGKRDYGRVDSPASVSTGSTTVTDAAITADDLGASVSGSFIPAGATITAVTPGASSTISAAATGDAAGIAVAINKPGQIVGITYFATTRNEFDARKQAHEDYEPAIPDVTVYLEGLGPDGIPNTPDDTVLNKYVTDHW